MKTWLSTLDIQSVLKQFEKKYTDFIFLGAVPADFDLKDSMGKCIVHEMCKLNLEKLYKRGIRKVESFLI